MPVVYSRSSRYFFSLLRTAETVCVSPPINETLHDGSVAKSGQLHVRSSVAMNYSGHEGIGVHVETYEQWTLIFPHCDRLTGLVGFNNPRDAIFCLAALSAGNTMFAEKDKVSQPRQGQ